MTEKRRPKLDPTLKERARKMRKNPTPAERRLWQGLRRRQVKGHYFRRQHPIGRYIVDFICQKQMLIIEVDGQTHHHREAYDAARTEWLEAQGYRVLRFTNDQVLSHTQMVLEQIAEALPSRPPL